jgi:hypothetical protein
MHQHQERAQWNGTRVATEPPLNLAGASRV